MRGQISVDSGRLFIVFSVAVFVILLPTLGPAAFLTLWVCAFFGYREFMLSRTWAEEKMKKLAEGVPKKKLREDIRLLGRLFGYVWLPLFAYCLCIYLGYQMAEGNQSIRDTLWTWFEWNRSFYRFSEHFYPTIGRHYAVAMHENIFRAEMLAHLYAVIFNGMILVPLGYCPALGLRVKQRSFEVSTSNSFVICVALLFVLSLAVIILSLYGNLLDAPHRVESVRWGYDAFVNNGFLQGLLFLAPASVYSILFCQYAAVAFLTFLFHRNDLHPPKRRRK